MVKVLPAIPTATYLTVETQAEMATTGRVKRNLLAARSPEEQQIVPDGLDYMQCLDLL